MKTTRTLCLVASLLMTMPAISLANGDSNNNANSWLNSISHHADPRNHPYEFAGTALIVTTIGLGYTACPWMQRNVNNASQYIGSFFCNNQASNNNNNNASQQKKL